MKSKLGAALCVLALLSVAALGYRAGTRGWLNLPPAADATASTGASLQPAAGEAERKVLYYRNPMGLPDTSPVPKKDAMGMAYIAVYEGEERAGSAILNRRVSGVSA